MMNNTDKILDLLAGTGASLSLATILTRTQAILGCISAIIAIISGVISIIIKVKNATSDGVITKEEAEDIVDEIKKIGDKK